MYYSLCKEIRLTYPINQTELFLSHDHRYISGLTYGAIYTSLLSLSSVAVDTLFLNDEKMNLGVDGKLKIDANEIRNSVKSQIIAIVFTLLLVITPKVTVFSWIIAAYREWSLLFLGLLMAVIIVLHSVRTQVKKKPTNSDHNEVNTQDVLKRSAEKTCLDMFGLIKTR